MKICCSFTNNFVLTLINVFLFLGKLDKFVAIWRLELIHETQCNGQLSLFLFLTPSIYKLLCLRHWALYLRVVTTSILFSILLLQCQLIVAHCRIYSLVHSRRTQQWKRLIISIQWKTYHYPQKKVTERIWFSGKFHQKNKMESVFLRQKFRI